MRVEDFGDIRQSIVPSRVVKVFLRIESIKESEGGSESSPYTDFIVRLPDGGTWPSESFSGAIYRSYFSSTNSTVIKTIGPYLAVWYPSGYAEPEWIEPFDPLMIRFETDGLLRMTFQMSDEIAVGDLVLRKNETDLFPFRGLATDPIPRQPRGSSN